jgi:hypothetical protein
MSKILMSLFDSGDRGEANSFPKIKQDMTLMKQATLFIQALKNRLKCI